MKKYSIIYADPPWQYKVYSKKGLGRSAESHYPTMELEDIRALPVGTLAADDCVLFLWTTIPLLHDCFSVMRAWGFSYKTVAFVWIKQNRKSDSLFWGMGHWTRANAEFCIKSYAAVCLEGAIIVLACIIFSLFASSPPVVDPDAAAVTQVWSYVGELIFNILVLVGAVKMADRVVREMMGL